MMPSEAVQRAHPGWLVFHSARTGLWSAYRHRPDPGDVSLVRAESAEELDRKLAAHVSPRVPPSIRAVAATRALRALQGRRSHMRRLLRS
ncbi:hypothetical protein [Streptosporangium saharense]|uniref:hypothetical protein n=1 Tax=Streptosporangium saharense TaxID=1706840 RepID=UPI0034364614